MDEEKNVYPFYCVTIIVKGLDYASYEGLMLANIPGC